MCQASVFITPRRKIIERGGAWALPSGAMQLPSASVTGTAVHPESHFNPELPHGLDCYKHKRNLNVLVVGGSGAGKSRAYAVVNIMQCNCSMVITDPKGELLRKTGGLLEREGYEVRVFDLINPENSFCYNPFAYVRDDKDVLKLINNLIRNTTPKGAQSSDPFWEKSETALLQALMLYLLHEHRRKNRTSP